MTFKDIDLTNLIERCEDLDGATLKTGIQQGSSHLQKAIWTNFGTRDIEPRPVISEFGSNNRGELADISETAANNVVYKKKSAKSQLNKMADKTEDMMRQDLIDYDAIPNMPATVAQKGFDDPWIETGETVMDVQAKIEGV